MPIADCLMHTNKQLTKYISNYMEWKYGMELQILQYFHLLYETNTINTNEMK